MFPIDKYLHSSNGDPTMTSPVRVALVLSVGMAITAGSLAMDGDTDALERVFEEYQLAARELRETDGRTVESDRDFRERWFGELSTVLEAHPDSQASAVARMEVLGLSNALGWYEESVAICEEGLRHTDNVQMHIPLQYQRAQACWRKYLVTQTESDGAAAQEALAAFRAFVDANPEGYGAAGAAYVTSMLQSADLATYLHADAVDAAEMYLAALKEYKELPGSAKEHASAVDEEGLLGKAMVSFASAGASAEALDCLDKLEKLTTRERDLGHYWRLLLYQSSQYEMGAESWFLSLPTGEGAHWVALQLVSNARGQDDGDRMRELLSLIVDNYADEYASDGQYVQILNEARRAAEVLAGGGGGGGDAGAAPVSGGPETGDEDSGSVKHTGTDYHVADARIDDHRRTDVGGATSSRDVKPSPPSHSDDGGHPAHTSSDSPEASSGAMPGQSPAPSSSSPPDSESSTVDLDRERQEAETRGGETDELAASREHAYLYLSLLVTGVVLLIWVKGRPSV